MTVPATVTMEFATTNFRTFTSRLYDNTPVGEVYVGNVLVTIDPCNVNLNTVSSRFFLKDMIEVDDLPTINILDFPDVADQPLQTDTVFSNPPASSIVPVDMHEGVDHENIDFPDFDNLDEAHDEFKTIADKVEAEENNILAREKKGIKKLSERKYQKLKQRVKMNITISRKERQHYEEQKALRELFSIVST